MFVLHQHISSTEIKQSLLCVISKLKAVSSEKLRILFQLEQFVEKVITHKNVLSASLFLRLRPAQAMFGGNCSVLVVED